MELLISRGSEAHWLVRLCQTYSSVHALIIWCFVSFVRIQDLSSLVLLHLITFYEKAPI